jgi:hypothetical protein
LKISRDTLHAWIRSGKVPAPAQRRTTRSTSVLQPPRTTPDAWAQSIRQLYDLTPTEDALVDMAAQAMRLAQNSKARDEVRLAAVSRFQNLVRQLDLEEPTHDGEAEKTPGAVRAWPRAVDRTPA